MIKIDQSDFIGKGCHRECYRHPENENFCFKIVVSGNDEVRREKKYYEFIKKRNVSWEMIPQYHGDIETSMGLGSVFDLVCDHTGEVSRTLEYYFSSSERTEEDYNGLSNALHLLKDYLLQQRIITTKLHPQNIVYKKMIHQGSRLFVVDSIGNSDLVPICSYSNYFGRKKILRKWRYFEKSMLKNYKHNKVLHRMLTSSHR